VPPDVQERFVLGDFILIDRRAKLKTLRPLGPTAGGIFALDREDRRPFRGIPPFLQMMNFLAGNREEPLYRRKQQRRSNFVIDVDHKMAGVGLVLIRVGPETYSFSRRIGRRVDDSGSHQSAVFGERVR